MSVITFQRITSYEKSKPVWSDAFSLYAEVRENEKTTTFICDTQQVNDKMQIKYGGAVYRIASISSKGVTASKTKELIK